MFIKTLNLGGIPCNIKDNCVSSLVMVNRGLATLLLTMLFADFLVATMELASSHSITKIAAQIDRVILK